MNRCRREVQEASGYDKLIAACARLLPAASEVAAVIKAARPGATEATAEMEVDEVDCGGLTVTAAADAAAAVPHPLLLPALEAWLASLAINSVLFASKDATSAWSLSGSLIAAVGKAASSASSSTFTPPILSPMIARLYRYRALGESACFCWLLLPLCSAKSSYGREN